MIVVATSEVYALKLHSEGSSIRLLDLVTYTFTTSNHRSFHGENSSL